MKKLVAYFSASGITRNIAEMISDISGADLFEIVPETPYSKADLDWMDKNSRSSVEMADKSFRPSVKNKLGNMNEYDVIYLGFPIWWYVAPTIINTFLEQYDFSGKIIVTFATSGSSDFGNTVAELTPSVSDKAVIYQGKLLNHVKREDVEQFVSGFDSIIEKRINTI